MLAVSDAVLVALILTVTPVSGLAGSIIIARRVTEGARQAKLLDWEREDLVAARAEQVSEALIVSNVAQAAKLVAIDGKQDIIHELVNSHYTAAMEREFAALVGQLAMMRELAAARGGHVTEEAAEALKVLEDQVATLRTELDERHRHDEVAVQAARALSDEHSAAEKQQDAALQQQQAAQMQSDAADKQIAVAEAQADVADRQAEANRTANPDLDTPH